MATPKHGDPAIDKEVERILGEVRKITTNQKYLKGCSRPFCKQARSTGATLVKMADDFYDIRADQQRAADTTEVKKLTTVVTTLVNRLEQVEKELSNLKVQATVKAAAKELKLVKKAAALVKPTK
jgi:hypothetical protein